MPGVTDVRECERCKVESPCCKFTYAPGKTEWLCVSPFGCFEWIWRTLSGEVHGKPPLTEEIHGDPYAILPSERTVADRWHREEELVPLPVQAGDQAQTEADETQGDDFVRTADDEWWLS